MSSTLQLLITHHPNAVIVKFIGEARLHVEDAETELDKVITERPQTLIVDASELTFLASIGMRLFMNLRRAVTTQGGNVIIVSLRPEIETALRRAHLLSLFDIRPDLTSALA